MKQSTLIPFDEALSLSSGNDIQMRDTNGNWVKFDETKVIRDFRKAPELENTNHDASRILRYFLYKIKEELEAIIPDDAYIGLPKKGIKPCWKTSCKVTYEEEQKLKYRLRDFFKQYFRIVRYEEDSENEEDSETSSYKLGVEFKCIYSENWDYILGIGYSDESECWYIGFDPGFASNEESDYQKVTSIESSNKPCDNLIHKVSKFIYNYILEVVRQVDCNIDNVAKVIDKNFDDSFEKTFSIINNKDVSYVELESSKALIEIFRYLNSLSGKYSKDVWRDYHRNNYFLFRYFNDRFNGTIDYMVTYEVY